MKRYLHFIGLVWTLVVLSGWQEPDQNQPWKLVSGLPMRTGTFLTTDALGNAYVVVENQILKFSPTGKPLQNFSESQWGELRAVDATNPLKVLLFYPDMARIVLLGTQFAPQSTIELRNIGIMQPTLACSSANEGYWIFDLQDFQVKKVNFNLEISAQSGNLLQITDQRVLPNFITEYNQRVYLNDPQQGILVFDAFGTYLKTIPVKGLFYFQCLNREILYSAGDSAAAIDLSTLTERKFGLPTHAAIRGMRMSDKQLYLLTTDSLNSYSY